MSSQPKRVTVYMPAGMATNLDRAIIEASAATGNYVSRSDVVVAIIESVDVPKIVTKLAKDLK